MVLVAFYESLRLFYIVRGSWTAVEFTCATILLY